MSLSTDPEQRLHLRQVLTGKAPAKLDRVALDLASIHFPELNPEPFLAKLNEIASQLGDRLRNFNDGRDFVEKAQSYLFGELGFRGAETDYDNPWNSCLNQVIERRTGIPITLSVLYMEIARRLQMPVYGIGLPRHFVLQFDDGRYSTYIDPFHGGRPITASECFHLAGAKVADPDLLQRVTQKYIAMRMLRNLLGVYARRSDLERAVAVLGYLLLGAPQASSFYRQRSTYLVHLHRYRAAREDLETYLRLEPSAEDRAEVLKQIQAIHQWIARWN